MRSAAFLLVLGLALSLASSTEAKRVPDRHIRLPLLTWERAQDTKMCQNLPAGEEVDGTPLFISQTVQLPRFATSISSSHRRRYGTSHQLRWHLGKAGPHLRGGMNYVHKGRLGTPASSGELQGLHYVLCWTGIGEELVDKGKVRLRWLNAESHLLSPQSIDLAGRFLRSLEGHQLICRVTIKGQGIQLGRFPGASKGCVVSVGHNIYRRKGFQLAILEIDEEARPRLYKRRKTSNFTREDETP